MGRTWGPSGADRTQVGPMLAPWTLLSEVLATTVLSTRSDSYSKPLTHWGRVTHICVSKLTINGADNDLSPVWCQAIIWTNAGMLLIGPLWTNFSEILIENHIFFHLKVSSGKWQPFCLSLKVLITGPVYICRTRNWSSLCLARHINLCDVIHDDVIKWNHFPRNWPFVWGMSPIVFRPQVAYFTHDEVIK